MDRNRLFPRNPSGLDAVFRSVLMSQARFGGQIAAPPKPWRRADGPDAPRASKGVEKGGAVSSGRGVVLLRKRPGGPGATQDLLFGLLRKVGMMSTRFSTLDGHIHATRCRN